MRITQSLLLATVLCSTACSSPDDASGEMHLVVVQAPETAAPGSTASHPILVKVVNGDGTSVSGIPVTWSVRSGGGHLSVSADTSGLDGLAAAEWTPGLQAAPQQIGVSIYDQSAITITVAIDGFHADRIDAGYGAVCGLQGTATWCWVRERNSGQTFRILSQVQAKTLALGDAYACVVDLAGVTYCNLYYWYQPSSPDEYVTVAGLPPISAISSGDSYYCGIDASDRTPWCWSTSPFSPANHVSSTLRLTSVAAGNGIGCGIAEDGATWCWYSFEAPVPVTGGHTFRQVSVGRSTACAIESPARLYCWEPGQVPVLMAGAAPAAIAMGYDINLMNVQSGARTFFADPGAAQLTFIEQADFPFPATQISGDDTPCLIAVDTVVYCLASSGSDSYPTDWTAIPAPHELASARGVP